MNLSASIHIAAHHGPNKTSARRAPIRSTSISFKTRKWAGDAAALLDDPSSNPSPYVSTVLTHYLVFAGHAPLRASTPDQHLARSLFDQKFPLAAVETALLLAGLPRVQKNAVSGQLAPLVPSTQYSTRSNHGRPCTRIDRRRNKRAKLHAIHTRSGARPPGAQAEG